MCVFSHTSIYNTLVLQLGKPIISRRQSFVPGGTFQILQAGTCQAWDIAAFMMCHFSKRDDAVVIMAISSPAYVLYLRPVQWLLISQQKVYTGGMITTCFIGEQDQHKPEVQLLRREELFYTSLAVTWFFWVILKIFYVN